MKIVALVRTALIALAIAFVPQGIWSALILANLRITPAVPWAVAVMAAGLWLAVRYRRLPRTNTVSRPVLTWAWIAGTCAIVALVGYWIVLASLVRMPGSVLPDLSGYPWWTAALAVVAGAAISPLCEQAGLWGYWQRALERDFSTPTALFVTAIAFAVLPHPPLPAPLWPKWLFFFLTGLTFAMMASLTDSILPGLAVHGVALLTFFVLVWPSDPGRRLVLESGPDGWFWSHAAQAVLFTGAACWAFRRLWRHASDDRAHREIRPSLPRELTA